MVLKRVSGHVYQRYDGDHAIFMASKYTKNLSADYNKDFKADPSLNEEPLIPAEDAFRRLNAVLVDSAMDCRQRPHETCYMCMDLVADAVLVECGHGGLCMQCADTLWRQGTNFAGGRCCPLCRRRFVDVMRILSETDDMVRCPSQLPQWLFAAAFKLSANNVAYARR